ncbi:YKL027W-like protein, partial [Syncephalis pseudoplumigaleata]
SAGIPFDRDDIAYIVEEVWRGKSVLSGTSDKLCLTRWDRRRPISFQNCVCLTKSEATRHDTHDPDRLHELYSAEELALVEKRFTEERYYSQWR